MITGHPATNAVSPDNDCRTNSPGRKPHTKRPSMDSGRHSMSMEIEESPNVTKSVATAPPVENILIAQNKPTVVKNTSMPSKYATIRPGNVKENKDITMSNYFMETETNEKVVTTLGNKQTVNSRSENKLVNATKVNSPPQVQRESDRAQMDRVGNSSHLDIKSNTNNQSSHRVHFGANEIKIISPASKSTELVGHSKPNSGHDDDKYVNSNRPYRMKSENQKLVSGTSTQTDISMGDLQTDDWKAENLDRGETSLYVSPTYRFTYPKYHANTHSVPYWELLRNLTQERAAQRNGRSLWDAVHKPTRINPMPWKYWK